MKLRHAAALALVGWYLMLPPPFGQASLDQWDILSAFDTAQECENHKSELLRVVSDPKQFAKFAAEAKKQDPTWNRDTAISRIQGSECVSTDDPRLKRN
jgi:hypothetical protein